jgi:hypothetical protein
VPRWELFLSQLDQQWSTGFNETEFKNQVFNTLEEPFTFDRSVFPTTSTGDQIAVATEIHQRYRPVTRQYHAFFDKLPEHVETDFSDHVGAKMMTQSVRPASGSWATRQKHHR